MQKAVVLIPALNPNDELTDIVKKLHKAGFHRLIVIDDGSDAECAGFFSEVEKEGCIVVHHPGNIGKGAALKSGIKAAIRHYGTGNAYITADCDGQHLPEDIIKVAKELERYPDTQTGLRGIPMGLENFALFEEGNRYEYEMNFLSDAARLVELRYVQIQTVYKDGNSASHFRPMADSVLVYGRFLRFVSASLTGQQRIICFSIC